MTQPVQTDRTTTGSPSPARQFDMGVVAWCVAAAVLLMASGFYRVAQAARAGEDTAYKALSPFPLKNIPEAIDTWRVLQGTDISLDPQTTRITGSTDHITRMYCDEMTGVTLSVLILYGPAGPVTPHSPQVCYPATGFAPVGPNIDRKIEYGPGEVADFRSAVFAKSGGRSMIYQTVYHSYQLNGAWSPTVDNRKLPRRNPGVFKVQIQRRSAEGETRGENEPIEAFVAKLLPIIERMTAEAQKAQSGAPTGAATPKSA